jgi:hypothetical protein
MQVFLEHAETVFDLFRRIVLNRRALFARPAVGTAAVAARSATGDSTAELRERVECGGGRNDAD